MMNTLKERAALSSFSRKNLSVEYKRMLCYRVYYRLETIASQRGVNLDRFISTTANAMLLNEDDVRDAVAALKSTYAFNTVSIWSIKGTNDLLIRSKTNDEFHEWVKAVNVEYPHFAQMLL